MAVHDMREFVSLLDKQGDLLKVKKEVESKYEVTCILKKVLEETPGKAVYFEQLKGYDMPAVGNLYSSVRNVLLGLGKPPTAKVKDVVCGIADSLVSEKYIQPTMVTQAPCQDVVIEGEKVNIFQEVPVFVSHELDVKPAIHAGVVIAKDPETGHYCLGTHTTRIASEKKLGSFIAQFRRVRVAFDKMEAKGEPLEVAIAIGVDPVLHLVAGSSVSYDVDKLEAACTVRGEPVEVVKCKTVDLCVPAYAEMIIEGRMLPKERMTLGTFSDLQGYYRQSGDQPVIEVTAITRRQRPVYQFLRTGRPVTEEVYMRHVMMSAGLLTDLRRMVPGVSALNITLGSGGTWHAVVSISKAYEGQPLRTMDAIWTRRPDLHAIIVVDEDVDPFDMVEVEIAMSTCVSPCRDVIITPEIAQSVPADDMTGRKTKAGVVTSRMGIDATRDIDWPWVKAEQHEDTMRKVEENWQQYFS